MAKAHTVVVHAQILPASDPTASPTIPEPPPPTTIPPARITPASTDIPVPPPSHATEPRAQPASLPSADHSGYLSIDEVDEPATPVGDWRIDTEVLPRGYTLRLVILVWISAGGNVDKWELNSRDGNRSYALKALEDLDRTALHPAIRNNIAVPSYRRLEIVITHE